MGSNDMLSRRGFIKGSAFGAAGVALGASALAASSALAENVELSHTAQEQAPGAGSSSAQASTGASATAGSASTTSAVAEDDASIYQTVFTQEMNRLPVKKVQCPGPRGPIAYEGRKIDESEILHTDECNVLVIGAGIGGLMATLKAADMGANVITLEKMTKGRGCFECFGAVDAKCQTENGITVDKALLLDELYRSAYWRTRPEPARTYVDRSGEATDFWQDMLNKGKNGFVISHVEQQPSACGMPAMSTLIDSELGFYDSPSLPADAGVRSGLSGIYVCLEMQDVAKTAYSTVDMRFSTPAVQLETDDSGRVIGCIAKDADGYFRVTADKGVVMATGGYDANPEMMEAWVRPEDYASSSWWNPGWGTTGDGHMMGLAIGAQMDPIPQPVMNFRWGNPDSFYDWRTWNAIWYAIDVNAQGKRYVNEDLPFQAVSNAQNAQPGYGANCWQIFDETMFGADDASIEAMKEAVAEFEAKGWCFEASSPADLAAACGIDPDGLTQTITDWNSYFDTGVDAEFNRCLDYYLPFTGKTYYALTTNSCILATGGGLMIDGNCQVLDNDDQPIPGLYACGNASGSFFSGNYPRHIPGTSIGRAITFGYVAASNIMGGE